MQRTARSVVVSAFLALSSSCAWMLAAATIRASDAGGAVRADAPNGTPPIRALGPGRGNGVRRLPSEAGASLPDPARALPWIERGARSAQPGSAKAAPELLTGEDGELHALREAESLLFPRSLGGVDSALDAQLAARPRRPGPAVSATGLPLAMSLLAVPRAPSPAWPRGLSLPNLPVGFEQRTLEYMRFYRDSRRGRAIAEAWARKAGRYSKAIQAELARAGLPTDLVWLSLIESGHNPTIRSPAGAAGLWQFIPESARSYGLTVDRWVDERLDPLRSTRAAALCLSDLHRRFGTWELAMAAYNMGYSGLMRAIRKYNTNDFWRLSRMEAALPWETALYVPKVLAVAIMMRNKRAFGLGDVAPDPPVSFDTIYVPPGIPLASIAVGAGLPESTIKSLNPHYLSARTPPPTDTDPDRRWAIYVPAGQGKAISQRLAKAGVGGARHGAYRVRHGDTPATIAERLGGSEGQLRTLNRIDSNERLAPGAMLLVPEDWAQARSGGAVARHRDTERWVVVQPQRFRYPERERVFYRTLPGDDLETLARAFQVRPEELVLWNGLDGRALLQSDMILSVYLPRGTELPDVRFAREGDSGKLLEAGTPGFLAHFEAEQGRERLQIMAREGDTLASIGRRYGLSPGSMERINHFSRNERLEEGTPVVVYAKNGPTATELLLSRAPDPLPPVNPPHPSALPPAPAR